MTDAACWCGNSALEDFSPDYWRCSDCQTLIFKGPIQANSDLVSQDELGYYGKEYWLSHQRKDLALPDIYSRARTDLTERVLHWLRTLLKYKLPPGKTLDIGCAHGGFVFMLQGAGFNASGLEVSRWVSDFARQTFDIPMLTGRLEDQDLQPASFDVLIMMDVLEHLPSPLEFLERCRELLKPDGILLIQTPAYPARVEFQTLVNKRHPFLKMLIPQEHLYLFSRPSLNKILNAAGLAYINFESAYFSQYDMFCVAGMNPFALHSADEAETLLLSRPQARLLQGLFDLRQNIQVRDDELLSARSQIDVMRREVDLMRGQVADAEAALKDAMQKSVWDQELIAQYVGLIKSLQSSTAYRFMRKLGRFSWFHDQVKRLDRAAAFPEKNNLQLKAARKEPKRIIVDMTPVLPGGANGGAKIVAIEIIRLLSREIAPNCEFILFTSKISHDELAFLDRENVRRICVNSPGENQSAAVPPSVSRLTKTRALVRDLTRRWPEPVRRVMASQYRQLAEKPALSALVKQLEADLVFSPFTAPFYHHPDVPMVILVHDIQFMYYPAFFSFEDVQYSDRYLTQSCNVADRLIAISDYTRQTLIEKKRLPGELVTTIPHCLIHPIKHLPEEEVQAILKNFSLEPGRYLLFPANFWRHKNHEMLLTAFGMYRKQHPQSGLQLVFTGASGERKDLLVSAVREMGLESHVHFAGFVSTDEYSAFLDGCLALIFPSLFEGFGMPVLEAMSFGKMVLCSNVTSLPEIGGDAVKYFDPRRPLEIIRAMEDLETHPELVSTYVSRGKDQAARFGDPRAWAQAYWKVFGEVCSH